MINVERSAAPDALTSPKVRDFLEKLVQYHNDPEHIPKPERPTGYREPEVLEKLDNDFLNKCYLTEMKTSSWHMDIDHFEPYNEAPNRVFDWTNLYPIDHQANRIKPRKTPTGGYLDPCSPEDDVETDILYGLIQYGEEPRFWAKDPENIRACNTAKLLKRLHGVEDEDTRAKTKHLRTSIKQKYDEVMKGIISWLAACKMGDRELELCQEEELKLLLSRNASFTMLLRSLDEIKMLVPKDFLD